jgi:peptide/nickel transport system permease protein
MRGIVTLAGRRVLQFIPVVIGVTFLAFCLLNLLPGGTAIAILGDSATKAQIAQVNHALGLDKPFWIRYGLWLWHAIHGDLGSSFLTHFRVTYLIGERLPVTAELIVLSIAISITAAVLAATFSARHPGGVVDWISRTVAMSGLAMPNFVFALLLLIVVSVKWNLLPSTGFVPLSQSIALNLKSMILPAVSVSLVQFSSWSRILRGDMVDQIRTEDYVLTAQSKGLGNEYVLFHHVLKNSLFSMITVIGTNLGVLIGGTVIIENIFGLPGMGQLLLTSINNRDAPVVQGIVVTVAVAVVCMNFLTDIFYLLLDPRVRYGSANS